MHCGQACLVVLIGVLQQLPFAAIGPLLPFEMAKRGFSQLFIGAVLSVYGVTWLCVPELTVKWLFPRCGRTKTAQIATLITGLAMLSLSIAGAVSTFSLFSTFAFIGRFLQGLGAALEQTSYTAVLAHKFEAQRAFYMQIYTLSLTVGLLSGPLMAGYLKPIIGYSLVFLIIGVLAFLKVFAYCAYPEKRRALHAPSHQHFPQQLGLRATCKICGKLPPLFALIAAYLISAIYTNYESVLATSLAANYDSSTLWIGLYFSVFVVASVAVSFPLAFLTSPDKRPFILASLLLSSVFAYIVGPSQMFQLPHRSTLTLIGVVGSGLSYGLGFNYLLPEAYRACEKTFSVADPVLLIDKVSSLIPTIWGLQKLLLPLYISAFDQSFGFGTTFDIVATVNLVVFVLHLLITLIDKYRDPHDKTPLDEDEEEGLPLLRK